MSSLRELGMALPPGLEHCVSGADFWVNHLDTSFAASSLLGAGAVITAPVAQGFARRFRSLWPLPVHFLRDHGQRRHRRGHVQAAFASAAARMAQ